MASFLAPNCHAGAPSATKGGERGKCWMFVALCLMPRPPPPLRRPPFAPSVTPPEFSILSTRRRSSWLSRALSPGLALSLFFFLPPLLVLFDLSVCLSVCLFVLVALLPGLCPCRFVCLSVCFCLSACVFTPICLVLSSCLSVYLTVYLFLFSACLSFSLSPSFTCTPSFLISSSRQPHSFLSSFSSFSPPAYVKP